MNERIGKLAVEAGALWHHGDWNMPSCVYFGEKDLEKFAELIVRECLDIVEAQKESLCDNENTWCDQDYGYEQAVNDSVDMVKKHFGVEE